ncbi:hypothetical protein ACROYT_G013592 [Oculina patagonica]
MPTRLKKPPPIQIFTADVPAAHHADVRDGLSSNISVERVFGEHSKQNTISNHGEDVKEKIDVDNAYPPVFQPVGSFALRMISDVPCIIQKRLH